MRTTIAIHPLGAALLAIGCALVAASTTTAQSSARDAAKQQRPTLTLKATPIMSFAPAKIHFVAEIKGGPNDDEDLYCPSVEWDWNDDTTSESSADCEPYRAGKSEIRRRFTSDHVYRLGGTYRVQIRLKKKSRVVMTANVFVQVSPGARDPG
jgi:hypothetical protein